jgi:hypothetical protein
LVTRRDRTTTKPDTDRHVRDHARAAAQQAPRPALPVVLGALELLEPTGSSSAPPDGDASV